MEEWITEIGWSLPPTLTLVRTLGRLVTATVLGAVVGLEREQRGMAAGLRTHMLVSLACGLFTLVPVEAGADSSDLSEIVKGIAAGIGFLGAGTILKRQALDEIRGLTTASSILLTSAVGFACGAGQMWMALGTVLLSLIILTVLHGAEKKLGNGSDEAKLTN